MNEVGGVWREFLRRAVIGFPWGGLGVCMLFLAGSAFSYPQPEGAAVPLVTAAMAEAFGSPVSAAMAQIFWSGLLGAALGTMGVPFLMERKVALWSAAHFLATAAVFSLAGWQCRWFPYLDTWLCLLGLLLLCYVLKWLVRFLEWQADIREIQRSSGLDMAEPWWKTLVPYLLLAAAVELLLPPGLLLVDAVDVPVLVGIFYPFVVLPLFCFFSACPLGTRLRRWWLVYPLACMLFTLPCIALIYNSSALFQVWMTGIPALAGGFLGIFLRQWKRPAQPRPTGQTGGTANGGNLKKFALVLSMVFIILTFLGAGYVLMNKGRVNAGYAAVPMVCALASTAFYRQQK